MSRAMGSFEDNWTLDCVCDGCNEYFANNLEVILGRDSREALFRLDLGLRSPVAAAQLLNRRIRTTIQDPGAFDGLRVRLSPTPDGGATFPSPVPQVALRSDSGEWHFLVESELTEGALNRFRESDQVEIKIFGIGADCDRLKRRLEAVGLPFEETHRLTKQPITTQTGLTVVHDIEVDSIIVRAACKIAFNYAAKVLSPVVVRDVRFDDARRFVRYGEMRVRLATVQHLSILVGPGASSTRIHACGLGWDRGYLVAVVSLFNEVTYSIRLCTAAETEFPSIRHFFDPFKRTISEAPIAS
jgi:hypothetical protein